MKIDPSEIICEYSTLGNILPTRKHVIKANSKRVKNLLRHKKYDDTWMGDLVFFKRNIKND